MPTTPTLTDAQAVQRVDAYYAAVARLKPRLCPKCQRKASGWPLYRGDKCSPAAWVNCIRHPRREWKRAPVEAA